MLIVNFHINWGKYVIKFLSKVAQIFTYFWAVLNKN